MIDPTLKSRSSTDDSMGVLTAHLGQYGSWLESLSEMRRTEDGPPAQRARENLERGRARLREGDSESALLSFQAALLNVLSSEHPDDVKVRQVASEELLELIRGEQ